MGVKQKKVEQLFTETKSSRKSDKEIVDDYQKIIADKLKDPDFAKKAAMIIEKMLNKG